MSLQLIFGGSGSGKTTFLYDRIIGESIRHPEQLYFMIVPEQFTMQAQKDIVTRHPRHGTMNIDIVSFQRLAYRVFGELSVEQREILDDMGKSLVLRRALSGCKKQLVMYGGQLGRAGFINRLKTTISEFCQYGVTPDVLQSMVPEAGNPLLKQKLTELSVIFRSFQDYIGDHYITTEEILDVLCRVLPDSELIRRSVIVLDGYAGFMPVQYRLIGLFLQYARQVVVTVTADPAVSLDQLLPVQNLFSMSSQMVTRLKREAAECGVEILNDIRIPDSAVHAPGLRFLEKHLFRYSAAEYRASDSAGGDSGLELYQAVNPSGETMHLVHCIQRDVKTGGLRYRDIAVVTGDLDGYGREISHQFEQNGIPYFLDDRRSIQNHPLVEMVRAALEVIQSDFSYESVFRCLRSGMAVDDSVMLDRMENYVLAMGIRGHRGWRRAWENVCRGAANLNLRELNAFKDRVIAPLIGLLDRFRGLSLHSDSSEKTDSSSVDDVRLNIRGMTAALALFLEESGAKRRMEEYQDYFTSAGELRLAKEYSQVWEAVRELFDRLSDLLGDEIVSRREYAEILNAGFAEISVGVIPATVDRVVVGDITRTRLAHIRVLYLVGVNDGIVPARMDGGSLLTDQERIFFSEHRLELAPTVREDGFRQRFFLYRVMTKPTARLVISWSGVGQDGKSRRPSYLVGELRKLFPDVPVTEQQREDQVSGPVYTMEEARRGLIQGLRNCRSSAEKLSGPDSETALRRFLEFYACFLRDGERKRELALLVDAAFYTYSDRGIGRAAARLLYGRVLNGSVTRLEQFAECAYAHFLKYGLELTERERHEIRAADIGNLFHASIDRCFRRVKAEGKDWRMIADGERDRLVSEAVEETVAEYDASMFSDSARNAFLMRRLEQITRRTVWALQRQIMKGDFEPAGFEVSFSADDHLDAMRIVLSGDEELHLRGRIDRLDLCEDEEHVYVRIIDYKSGSTGFDLMALYYGLQLQLVIYMDAVLELAGRRSGGRDTVPAGIFYYNIADPFTEKNPGLMDTDGSYDRSAIDRELLRELKMNGLVNSDPAIIRHLDNTIEKESDVIPVVLQNGQVVESRSSAADSEHFSWLRQYVRKKVRETGLRILKGEAVIAPFRQGNRTACDYCPYHAVCGFDRKVGGYDYRRLKKMKTDEIWEEICHQ